MMTAPALFSFDDIKPLLGEAFALRGGDDRELPLVLSEAISLGFHRPREQGGQESFSLVFHAPPGTRMAQGNYELRHPRLGRHALFFVPLGPDATGLPLQAVFNFC